MGFLRREPVVSAIAGFDAVLLAGLSLAVSLGWLDLSGEQLAGVAAFVGAASAFAAKVARGLVTPVDSAELWAVQMFEEGFDEAVTQVSSGVLDGIFGAGRAEGS